MKRLLQAGVDGAQHLGQYLLACRSNPRTQDAPFGGEPQLDFSAVCARLALDQPVRDEVIHEANGDRMRQSEGACQQFDGCAGIRAKRHNGRACAGTEPRDFSAGGQDFVGQREREGAEQVGRYVTGHSSIIFIRNTYSMELA
jgi:hypothetical protein